MLVYYRKYKIILKINDLKFTNCFWKQIYIINNKKNMCLTTINYFLFLENIFFFLGLNKYFFVLGWELCLVSCNHGRKYRVSMGFDTIFHGEISVRRYFGISREKSPIFRRYIAWSTRVNESQTRYSVVNALQWCYSRCYSASPLFVAERIWTPNLLVWGSPAYHLG